MEEVSFFCFRQNSALSAASVTAEEAKLFARESRFAVCTPIGVLSRSLSFTLRKPWLFSRVGPKDSLAFGGVCSTNEKEGLCGGLFGEVSMPKNPKLEGFESLSRVNAHTAFLPARFAVLRPRLSSLVARFRQEDFSSFSALSFCPSVPLDFCVLTSFLRDGQQLDFFLDGIFFASLWLSVSWLSSETRKARGKSSGIRQSVSQGECVPLAVQGKKTPAFFTEASRFSRPEVVETRLYIAGLSPVVLEPWL